MLFSWEEQHVELGCHRKSYWLPEPTGWIFLWDIFSVQRWLSIFVDNAMLFSKVFNLLWKHMVLEKNKGATAAHLYLDSNRNIREAKEFVETSRIVVQEKRKAEDRKSNHNCKKSRKTDHISANYVTHHFTLRTTLARHKWFFQQTEVVQVYKYHICKNLFKRKENLKAQVKSAHEHASMIQK